MKVISAKNAAWLALAATFSTMFPASPAGTLVVRRRAMRGTTAAATCAREAVELYGGACARTVRAPAAGEKRGGAHKECRRLVYHHQLPLLRMRTKMNMKMN